MYARMQHAEYLGEVREQVCDRCPERVPDEPPFRPRCRRCGIELQLPQIVESIHAAGAAVDEFDPAPSRELTCARCVHLYGPNCPCPVGTLTARVVRAVKAVDERREQRELLRRRFGGRPRLEKSPIGRLIEAYEAATGTGVYCD